MQQLRAAQNRVEKLNQDSQQIKPQEHQQEQQHLQQQNQDPNSNVNTLNHLATMNIYNNASLNPAQQQNALQNLQPKQESKNNSKLTELKEAQNEVGTQEKLLAEVKGSPESQNKQAKELKGDPEFQNLPDDLKKRADIKDLMKTVEREALLDPDKAVDSLVDQALMGNKKAFIKLSDYSKNPYDKLQDNAGKGMDKVMGGADSRPKILEMIASTPTEKAGEAAAKLLNLADKNPRAQEGIERLIKNGDVNFSKVADQAKDMDPASAASSISMLMKKGSLSKEDRKGAVGVLSNLAKESPTGAAGKVAAEGLVNAVKSEPMEIARSAADGLKDAVLNGNPHALSGLQKLAKSDDPQKSQLALSQLGEVAKTGSASSGESLQTINKVAQDPGSNGKVKSFAVETMGKVANAGGANSQEAVNNLSNIAVDKGNSANGFAFNEIGKMNNATTGNIKAKTNPKNNMNLSDSETYQKVMATQQQMNTMAQQSPNFLQQFALNFMNMGMKTA
jgi:hypothetical protein